MATPNYGYEKRQKELAKKRKKEDKLKAKAERKLDSPSGESNDPELGLDSELNSETPTSQPNLPQS